MWTVACQAPLSMGSSRQEYWSGLSCSPLKDLPNPGTEPASLLSPVLAGGIFATSATWEALEPRRTFPVDSGQETHQRHASLWPTHLGEDCISLANEAFTLVELPLPRKEPVHLSGLPSLAYPAPWSSSPQPPFTSLDISYTEGGFSELPTGPGNLRA